MLGRAVAKRTQGGKEDKMPLDFSSDLDFLAVDVRLCHRRARELMCSERLIQPSELQWLVAKLESMTEMFNGQETE